MKNRLVFLVIRGFSFLGTAACLKRAGSASAIVIVGIAVLLLSSCGTYWRILRHGFSGVEDYRIFSGRKLEASTRHFEFRDETQSGRVADKVNISGQGQVSLEATLNDNATLAFLVIQDDAIVYERYSDEFARDSISLSFSMAKSVLALLIGCAIDDGLIGSVDDPVTKYLPELKEKGFEKVTLRHLLMSTSGLDYVESDNPFGIHVYLYYCENCIERKALDFKLAEPPGMRFIYKSGDDVLLGTALRRALQGETITAYLQRRVWTPLGMEHEGIWSTDGDQEKTWCCLSATARDFAKFGMLYLCGGVWRNERIVSQDWVKKAATVEEKDGASWQYQFQWWHPFRDHSHYMMAGHLGQYVYVNPDTRVVVVRLGKSRGGFSSEQWWALLSAVSENVRPQPQAVPDQTISKRPFGFSGGIEAVHPTSR
jgi:CubicO group peptidase (beta-lactamase class C family)